MIIPTEVKDLMDPNSVFVKGMGLYEAYPDIEQFVGLAASFLQNATYGFYASQDEELIRAKLADADITTRRVASELQKIMGTKVSISMCLGLARSLVEKRLETLRP